MKNYTTTYDYENDAFIFEILKTARERGGATLENYCYADYTSGYQVSKTENGRANMTCDWKEAIEMIKALSGNCGIWYDGGFWYIETSYHMYSLTEAYNTAMKYNQISIYDWANDSYIYLQ